MHEAPDRSETATRVEEGAGRSPEQRGHPGDGPLSQSDPEPEGSIGRPPIWLIIVFVVLVGGFVVLRLTGQVFGASGTKVTSQLASNSTEAADDGVRPRDLMR